MKIKATDHTTDELNQMILVATLSLKAGASNRGKQRLKQWGSRGRVMMVRDSIQASSHTGPFFAVAAGDPSWRWVHHSQDPDFHLDLEMWPTVEAIR